MLENSRRILPPHIITTGELVEVLSPDNNGHAKLSIELNPYIPFDIMSKLLGWVWMSGCWAGLAIIFASDVFGLRLLSLLFMMLCILFLTISMFIYMDA